MIPKIIHYCWLSEDPMPSSIIRCMDSWKRVLSNYEFRKWDLKRFPLDKSEWVKQAYKKKKYAFAADYIRLYALYTEGGIYLDCDVEVLKPYDDLLQLPYFICKENSPQGIEAATIGADKGCSWIGRCLDYYEDRLFINEKGEQDTRVLPAIINEALVRHYKVIPISNIGQFDAENGVVCVFSSDFFSPKSYITKEIKRTGNTYSIHHFSGSWQPCWKKLLLYVWVPFSVEFPQLSRNLKKIWKGWHI